MQTFDVLVLGAGAAGLMCAAQVGRGSRARGWRVGLLDHSDKLAEKIRISGGGRCNFTNRVVTEHNFVSANPCFARAALSAYTPDDFISLVKSHRIPYHEKHKGQLFCDRSSEDIIEMLASECRDGGVHWLKPHAVQQVQHSDGLFRLDSTAGPLTARHLVIATGGLPVPKIGATDFGLRVAKQFGHALVDQRPALVPLTFDAAQWGGLTELAGVTLPVRSRGSEAQAPWFDEDLLFTHRGLSGPAILQASSYWNPGEPLVLNLSGGHYTADAFTAHLLAQAQGSKAQADNWLAAQLPHWPRRLLQHWLSAPDVGLWAQRKAAELGKKQLGPLAASVAAWVVRPSGTEGYKKAEVMRGGVSTADLQPKTLESRRVSGLYFIGEVVDVTGWLGGYNFQWAWASGVAAARGILSKNA
ncbi:NAD(P)/FAD-dependent oxidoreductase [Limnobacter humi]|uniref:NAD(P)/FAD-dependent oxidoreductase n=1 Tax=Limnobacter humi TaxID=1778671 RepID=A0ABT1WHI6_9BURK|nr:NAD(P)/FAD-dependent oxidoreductase [Limnobacter humi]MCQ8896968.1 NAD(P)/FAD-dependent oxidoreductase [Limnobacter humi]